jgi:peptidoglycan/LPS O-acetylase OafA/YrhL
LERIISIFQRTTSTKNFIPEIDGLRFIAIITVVIFHFHFLFVKEIGGAVIMDIQEGNLLTAGWWLVRMDLGVKIFFGISGFILSIPFFKYYWFEGRKVDVKAYFIRRLTRLEPPFLIAVTGFLFVHVFILDESFVHLLPHYLATVLYLHTSIYNEYSIINPVTWSLETEVQFYLLIPLLAYLVLPIKNRGLVLVFGIFVFLGSIVFRGYILSESPYGLLANIGGFMSHFMVGIFFAYLYLTKEEWLKRKNLVWDVVGIISILGIFWLYKPQVGFWNQIGFNFSIFILFISVFKGSILNRIMTLPIIYLIGGMCYSIYLLHLAFFGLLVKVFSRFLIFDEYSTNLLFFLIPAFLLLMAISGAFFVFVEKPCMDKNWHHKFFKNRIKAEP